MEDKAMTQTHTHGPAEFNPNTPDIHRTILTFEGSWSSMEMIITISPSQHTTKVISSLYSQETGDLHSRSTFYTYPLEGRIFASSLERSGWKVVHRSGEEDQG